jgi:glycosyltransferase involved in cell wall biosynthesis
VIALIHRGNTAGKNLTDRCWTRRPLGDVAQLLGGDREFYVALRTGARQTPVAPASSAAIAVAAHFSVTSGYGSMAEYLVRGLARAGAQVHAVPLSLDPRGLSDEFNRQLHRGAPPPASPTIYFCWPQSSLGHFRGVPDLFINTMWESARLPAGWADALDRARSVIVPSRFVADACRASGVSIPIDVVAEGVDPEVYHFEERPERPGITTLTIGPVNDRKHVDKGIDAWKRAFAGDGDARLIVKTQYGYHNYTPDDDRISYVDCIEHTRGIAHWYRQADVLLALGNEGFGLPLIEAMATGLPVVALASEGQADVCEEARDVVLAVPPATHEPYSPAAFGDCGLRGVPSVTAVADRLTWVRQHRAEAREMGRAASAWVLTHRSIWQKPPAVLDILERRVQPPRPLRRHHTLWVPTFEQRCGIAEYTRDLTASMRGVAVTTGAPDLRRVRVLHVQHHHGLFNDADLASEIARAKMTRVPVVVTEHLVHAAASSWEADATALVSPSARGASLLARRWPGKPVHYIPHGCPPPLPPARRAAGRVIGAFGFLENHKGMFALLDVLRTVPGTELLLYSYAKSAEIEARWEAAAAGLPVHRVSSYLPAHEIAQQLSERASVIAFWYDDVPFGTASYAIRIALSTGVPVLASPTVWFEDLADVTYQPSRLAEGVRELLGDDARREALTAAARRYCEQHAWERIAARHDALWRTLGAN